MQLISVVMPALNEVKGVQATINAIPKGSLAAMGYDTEIIVVDNGSANGTPDVAKQLGATVLFEAVRGYGSAIRAGLYAARGDIIFTTDADGTYPMLAIPPVVRMMERCKYNFVTMDRLKLIDEAVMPPVNRVGNHLLSAAMRGCFGISINDSQTGMHAIRRSLLYELRLRFNDYGGSEELKIEACYFCRANWIEVPIRYTMRLGDSKLKWWKHGSRNMARLLQKWWQR